MTPLLVCFLVLAVLPILLTVLSRRPLIRHKQSILLADLKELNAFRPELNLKFVSSQHDGEKAVKEAVERLYSLEILLPPACLLSLLYLVGFQLCHATLRWRFFDADTWPYTPKLLEVALPFLLTFVGVYLFSLGMVVRRLYLADLTEHIYWGAIYRLLLSLGLALVLNAGLDLPKSGAGREGYYALFFGVGFLANVALTAILETAAKLGKFWQKKTPDVPLQAVRGINLWREYRLEEEGIENIQNLATADVVELAVKTHYKLRTLIDWIDQAIVIDRLGDERVKKMWEAGIPVSAIELAWQSPENRRDSIVPVLAKALGMDETILTVQMNALFEDAYVASIWDLWQRGSEARTGTAGRLSIPLELPTR